MLVINVDSWSSFTAASDMIQFLEGWGFFVSLIPGEKSYSYRGEYFIFKYPPGPKDLRAYLQDRGVREERINEVMDEYLRSVG